jgi:hypothetical protein
VWAALTSSCPLPASFVSTVLELPWVILANLPTVLPVIASYTPTFFAFLAFVLWNGGIVLGHQEYHGVSLHLPQTAYFFTFATALGGPALLDVGIERFVTRAVKDSIGRPRCVRLLKLAAQEVDLTRSYLL